MIDSIKVAADTIKTGIDSLSSANSINSLQNIHFDPSNIISNNGLVISIVGYVVVFLALLMLYIVFTYVTKILIRRQRRRLKASGAKSDLTKDELSLSGEVNAAIGMALYLHFSELHDFENTVLTIKKIQKTYSPWSSKIYGLRENPRKG